MAHFVCEYISVRYITYFTIICKYYILSENIEFQVFFTIEGARARNYNVIPYKYLHSAQHQSTYSQPHPHRGRDRNECLKSATLNITKTLPSPGTITIVDTVILQPAKVTCPEDGLCNEAETSASGHVHIARNIQTRSIPEVYNSDVNSCFRFVYFYRQ